jgi:hypothetical protein
LRKPDLFQSKQVPWYVATDDESPKWIFLLNFDRALPFDPPMRQRNAADMQKDCKSAISISYSRVYRPDSDDHVTSAVLEAETKESNRRVGARATVRKVASCS